MKRATTTPETTDQVLKNRLLRAAMEFADKHPVVAGVLAIFVLGGGLSIATLQTRARPYTDPLIVPVVVEYVAPISNRVLAVEMRLTTAEKEIAFLQGMSADRESARTNMWRSISEIRSEIEKLKLTQP